MNNLIKNKFQGFRCDEMKNFYKYQAKSWVNLTLRLLNKTGAMEFAKYMVKPNSMEAGSGLVTLFILLGALAGTSSIAFFTEQIPGSMKLPDEVSNVCQSSWIAVFESIVS